MRLSKSTLLIAAALLFLLLAGFFLHGQQLQKMDLGIQWQRPNIATNPVFNVRILGEGSLTYDYRTWPVLAVLTNSTTHVLYNIWENQKVAVSHTNVAAGAETTADIQPIYYQWFPRTNGTPVTMTNAPAPATNAPAPRAEVKQSLNLWWKGPPNWQAEGGTFNVRTSNPGSLINDYKTWPVAARVTNILNTKFYNVNPTQWYAISFTNAAAGTESTQGVGPVTAQYNWQGLPLLNIEGLEDIEAEDADFSN